MGLDNDNGYTSRKFWLVVIAMLLMTVGFCATAWKESFRPEFGTYGSFILALVGVYSGINLAHKVFVKPSGEKQDEVDTTVPPDEPEKK